MLLKPHETDFEAKLVNHSMNNSQGSMNSDVLTRMT